LPFREPRLPLQDIVSAIVAIEEFTANMDFEAFRSDPKTVSAVERKLSVISEAAVRVGAEGPLLCPDVPWHNIRGMGNWLRHQYDRIDTNTVWNTVTQDLPPLRIAAQKALDALSG
jgi:uncharacterized protein with HEPN domain